MTGVQAGLQPAKNNLECSQRAGLFVPWGTPDMKGRCQGCRHSTHPWCSVEALEVFLSECWKNLSLFLQALCG